MNSFAWPIFRFVKTSLALLLFIMQIFLRSLTLKRPWLHCGEIKQFKEILCFTICTGYNMFTEILKANIQQFHKYTQVKKEIYLDKKKSYKVRIRINICFALSASIRNQSDFETSWLGNKLFLMNWKLKYLIFDIYNVI